MFQLNFVIDKKVTHPARVHSFISRKKKSAKVYDAEIMVTRTLIFLYSTASRASKVRPRSTYRADFGGGGDSCR